MEETLTPIRYSKRGRTIASYNQKNIEIVGGVLGDTLIVDIHRKKGKLLSVLNPSPDRVTPRCRHVGSCGGCAMQQVSYEAQLKWKQEFTQALFSEDVASIIPCTEPWAYRNKMEFSFSQNRDGDRFLGLIIAASRGHVLNLEECAITSPFFSDTLKSVREWWENYDLRAYHMHKDEGALRTLTLREGKNTGEQMAMLTVSGNPRFAIPKEAFDAFSALFPDTTSVFLRIHQAQKGQPTQFFELHQKGETHIREKMTIRGRTYEYLISPSSFFQPNTHQAEKLYEAALSLATLTKETRVLDLYCGTGTIGMSFAPHVKEVIGVELSPYAVYDAQANLELNQIENMTVHKGDVKTVLSEKSFNPDLIILDPPRSGLDPKALEEVMTLAPKEILYIACNVETQARDIALMKEKGYQVTHLQPVDQFPHTPHIENIARLISPITP